MVPNFTRSKTNHTLVNTDNGATIAGFAATGDVASGGRKTVFVCDELAKFPRGPDKEAMDSTQHVTNSRVIISTPKGPDGAYFEAMHADTNMEKVILDWTVNPTRNVGCYRVLIEKDNSRRVELDDEEYWLEVVRRNGKRWAERSNLEDFAKEIVNNETDNPFGYPFMIETPYTKHGKKRSPWYDRECKRVGATPQGIAQELDRDYGGSTSRFYDSNMLHRVKEGCTPPVSRCELAFGDDVQSHVELKKPVIVIQATGRVELWFEPDIYHRAPQNHTFFVGVDVAAGTGGVQTSNSVIQAIDATLRKQVLQFASPSTSPYKLADLAVAICYWLSGPKGSAILAWEANGLGSQFTDRVLELGYSRIYYRSTEEQTTKKDTKKIGWWTTIKNKPTLLGELGRAMDSGDLQVCSEEVPKEAMGYVNLLGGKVDHVSAKSEEDPAGAGANHGDRVIGLSLAWWMTRDYIKGRPGAPEEKAEVPHNSFMGRRKRRNEIKKRDDVWVPHSASRQRRVDR